MAIAGARPDESRVVPHLVVPDVAEAIRFYQRAFDAKVLYESPLPSGQIAHAHVQVYDSVVMLTWEKLGEDGAHAQNEDAIKLRSPRTLGATTVILELYVDDVDAAFERAADAGGTTRLPVSKQFYGDRYGMLEDPFGYVWALATVQETLTPDAVNRRASELFAAH